MSYRFHNKLDTKPLSINGGYQILFFRASYAFFTDCLFFSCVCREPPQDRPFQWDDCYRYLMFALNFHLGTPDPFVRISIGTEVYSTKPVKKTLSPVWNQSFTVYEGHGMLIFYLSSRFVVMWFRRMYSSWVFGIWRNLSKSSTLASWVPSTFLCRFCMI